MFNRDKIMLVIESGIANLKNNEEKVNSLNVFPVPDGDTGTNMINTLLGGWNNIKPTSNSLEDILRDFSMGCLMSARGNSGVITSQIIKGAFEGYKKVKDIPVEEMGKKELKIVIKSAKEYAYRAVENPTEGTILTILKKMDHEFKDKYKGFKTVFKVLHTIAQEGTKETKDQLDVLKKANVVDSGAYGLTLILKGFMSGYNNNPIKLAYPSSLEELTFVKKINNVNNIIKADPNQNMGYCTEFVLTLRNPDEFNKNKFIGELKSIGGESIVAIVEEDIFKLHVHTKSPGTVFNMGQKYGEFSTIKADNMTTQILNNHDITEEYIDFLKSDDEEDQKMLGIIAVANGKGIENFFYDLGVDYVITGGQSMNPSVKDFMDAISKIKNKSILILPNNSNIILAAKLVKKTFKGKKNIFVLPTKTIQQGIVAIYNLNKEMVDFKSYEKNIRSSYKKIVEGEITKAIKTVKIDNVMVNKDDFILVSNRKILKSNPDIFEAFKYFIDKKINETIEIVTIFLGKNITAKEEKIIKEIVDDKLADLDVDIRKGDQDIYDLIILGE